MVGRDVISECPLQLSSQPSLSASTFAACGLLVTISWGVQKPSISRFRSSTPSPGARTAPLINTSSSIYYCVQCPLIQVLSVYELPLISSSVSLTRVLALMDLFSTSFLNDESFDEEEYQDFGHFHSGSLCIPESDTVTGEMKDSDRQQPSNIADIGCIIAWTAICYNGKSSLWHCYLLSSY